MLTKDDFKKRKRDPSHISGIFNYCDRWCERCGFSDRCASWALEKQLTESGEETTPSDKFESAFNILKITFELIQEEAERLGVDLSDIEKSDDEENEPEHLLLLRCKRHFKLVWDWVERNHDEIVFALADELEEAANRNHISLVDFNEKPALSLQDSFQLISRYSTLIYTKIGRTLTPELVRGGADEIDLHDANGSAKVALIAIFRSKESWGCVRSKLRPNRELQKIVATLDEIERQIERLLPEARNFKRPGFDT